ncbi:hypothetical protein LCGC14_1674850, partial [marine sediment metagenome]
AHVLAHSDFFANNIMFKECGETNMISVAKRHAEVIDGYRRDYGDDEVDECLDIALSLERHIDVHRGRKRQKYPKRHVEYIERTPSEWEDIAVEDQKPLVKKVIKGLYLPPIPEKDLLWFLSVYANLEPWQQRIFEIVRRESYYFYPQFRTRVTNEGYASFYHAELMRQYSFGNENDYGVKDIEFPLTSEEHLDFAAMHEKVVQPGMKLHLKVDAEDPNTGKKIKMWNPIIQQHPHLFSAATRLNPYYVGFQMFRDIKERWDEYYEQGYYEDDFGREVPVTINGNQKIREVMMEEDDVSFFRKYLTDDLCEKLHLFDWGNTDKFNDNYEIQEESFGHAGKNDEEPSEQIITNRTIIVKTKETQKVINAMALSRNNYGVPLIVIRRIDDSGLMRLEHLADDKINIDIKYAEHVLKYVNKAWCRPVEMIRKDKDRTWILRYDGISFEVDYEKIDYPESIEEGASPSSW